MIHPMNHRSTRLLATVIAAATLALSSAAIAGGGDPPDRPDHRAAGKRRGLRSLLGDGAPKVGDVAPPFKLKSVDGKASFDLRSFSGKRPVVLFFGSYT